MPIGAKVVLAINCGSSNVKCALFTDEREPQLVARSAVEQSGDGAVAKLLEWLGAAARPLVAIGPSRGA
ncbi:MAG TPA: hypothetical protein VL284_01455 [Thermoanaerobaculia bacterium]|nr:hypothetical protein [Thermoanaerobaculia bacterium]